MSKKIAVLLWAYNNGTRVQLIKAAMALVSYSNKHTMSICLQDERNQQIVLLAHKIVSAAN